MPSRSWMAAALALIASTSLPTSGASDDTPTLQSKVVLQLQITGLGSQGCTLKIAPAHPGCTFPTIERRVLSNNGREGLVSLKPIELLAQSTAADRDCSFAITITEPNQPPRTYHRGIRLEPPRNPKAPAVQTVKLYLTAPSLASREDATRKRR